MSNAVALARREPAGPPGSRPAARPAVRYTIGELAREFGVTTRTIRFYEDCGLLEPSRSGRNRVYTARDRARLLLTVRGKRLGLKLAEVKELIEMYDSKRDTGPQLRRFLAVLAAHRAQIEQRMVDLQATLDEVVGQQSAAQRVLDAKRRAA